MQSWQKARIIYMVKNGSQHKMKPPTINASVLAAFVSIRKRFACTLNMRRPTPLIVLLPSAPFASNWLVSLAASLLHKNDSMFSLRFNVICIMCKIGLLLVMAMSFAVHSLALISLVRDLARHSRRRSNDVVPILFDGFKWCPVNGGDIRGTLFDRLPRWMRNVKRVSSKRFCFDEPAIIQCHRVKYTTKPKSSRLLGKMKWNGIFTTEMKRTITENKNKRKNYTKWNQKSNLKSHTKSKRVRD